MQTTVPEGRNQSAWIFATANARTKPFCLHVKNVAEILALLGTLALLAGCVHYRSEPLSPQATADRFQERSLTAPALRSYIETKLRPITEWPLPCWNLTTLTLAAFYLNPDLELARATYLVVDAGRATAAQRPNPTLTISPAYNTTLAIPSPWLVTASLDVPLETAGKRGKRLAHATQLTAAARFAVAKVAWDIRGRLRLALVNLWAAQEGAQLLGAQQAAEDDLVRLLEKEQRAGGIASLEVTRERMARERTRLAMLDAESRLAQSRAQLAAVVGVPLHAFEGVKISYEEFEKPPSEMPSLEARRRSLLNRVDVLGALAEYEVAETALQLEIAKQYPDVHLTPGYEFDQGDNKWGVGVGIELPILNRNRGPILEASARRREAAARFNALQAHVLAEVESARAGFDNARKKFAAAASMLEQAQQQERATETSFKAGEISRQVLAAARLESATAAIAQLETRFKTQQARAALEAALQSPLEFPIDTTPIQSKSTPLR